MGLCPQLRSESSTFLIVYQEIEKLRNTRIHLENLRNDFVIAWQDTGVHGKYSLRHM